MTFAVKIAKGETITLSSKLPTSLTITNITLAPQSKKANLFLKSKEDQILITKLEQGRNQQYSCSISLYIKKRQTKELKVTEGQVHLIGHIKGLNCEEEKMFAEENLINITRKSNQHKKQSRSNEKERKKQIKSKGKNIREENTEKKKGKSLLQMVSNLDNIQDEQDDDQSFSAQDEESSSQSESQEREEQKETKNDSKERGMVKKVSWANMLEGAEEDDDQQSDEYSVKSEQNESDESEDSSEEEQILPKKKNKIQEPRIAENIKKPQKPYSASGKLLPPPAQLPLNIQSESSSFEFDTPKGLPSFVTKR